jgi:hypothetical protein
MAMLLCEVVVWGRGIRCVELNTVGIDVLRLTQTSAKGVSIRKDMLKSHSGAALCTPLWVYVIQRYDER